MLPNRLLRSVTPSLRRLTFPSQAFACRIVMTKRKRSSAVSAPVESNDVELPPLMLARRASKRKPAAAVLDPKLNAQVFDGPAALRASPDSDDANEKLLPHMTNGFEHAESSVVLKSRDVAKLKVSGKKRPSASQKLVPETDPKFEEMVLAAATRRSALKGGATTKLRPDKAAEDVEAEDDIEEEADPNEIKEALSRPPPVNSNYLPLPWKGRLGYACLCTYLRNSNPPVFQSRTLRIASILEHRHPLKDPTQPEHPTKNRPDKEKPADVRLGQQFVEQLCLANCRDMARMLRWNDKYNIRFLRLSSEAFPFASHAEYGYKLAPFASEALAEVGKVAAELGHRLTTHPGQFTQLGSPRQQVIDASMRDLEYHAELLSLLKLPHQQDRDAVMIIHLGGMFGDKEATLDRFRTNYRKLSPGVKKRLVLENDDMCWNVHDLLPICKELNIPLVLDFHHNNIIFESTQMREGTQDIIALFPAIRETWTRKGITQKMHYSEPTPQAITPKQRRKHSPRVATLPPCPDDMDLMIEAKDKEQAVFELMRAFKLPGYDTISDIQPHIRRDDNKPVRMPAASKTKSKKTAMQNGDEHDEVAHDTTPTVVPDEEVGMGGPEGRVYWPPGMEDWLRPVKKVVKKKEPHVSRSLSSSAKTQDPIPTPKPKSKPKPSVKKATSEDHAALEAKPVKPNRNKGKATAKTSKMKKPPSVSADDIESTEDSPEDEEAEEEEKEEEEEEEEEEEQGEEEEGGKGDYAERPAKAKRGSASRKSVRAKRARVSYKEEDGDES